MNQFNNIGSMFPGANNKLTREKTKQVLMTPFNTYQITGLVLTNVNGDKCIVDNGVVQWLKAESVAEIARLQETIARLQETIENLQDPEERE
jgi:cell division protein FtsB